MKLTNDNYPGDIDLMEGIPILEWLEDHVMDWGMIKITDWLNKRFKFHPSIEYGYWEPVWELAIRIAVSVLLRSLKLQPDWNRMGLRRVVRFNTAMTIRHQMKQHVPIDERRDNVEEILVQKAWARSIKIYKKYLGELEFAKDGQVKFTLP